MKIRYWLYLLFASSLLALGIIAVTLSLVHRHLERGMVAQDVYREIDYKVFALALLTYGYYREPLERRLEQWRQVHAHLGRLLERITDTPSEMQGHLDSLLKEHGRVLYLFDLLVEDAGSASTGTSFPERRHRIVGRLSIKLNGMINDSATLLKQSRAEVRRTQALGNAIVVAVTASVILLQALLIIALGRTLARHFSDLRRGAGRLAAGDLDYRIAIRDSNELTVLAAAFNEMADSLQERSAELGAINREMEAFTYSVSHDLRAPLRGIDGFTQALQEDYSDCFDETGRDYIDRVRRAAQRMGGLIDDLLRLSRIGRQEVHFSSVDLSALALEVAAVLREREPERAVEIDVPPELLALGDRELLRVALENLLGNAWKFTSRTETPRIEVGRIQDSPERPFFVRDNGAGFDMAYGNKLFAPFQRLHTEAEFPGTGIGAALVQRIIHRHGGRIWAEGAIGKGACFYFTLPEERP